ncbi:MAG: DUF2892 domain-containing protein [Gammaproteobacteria bacterium]
MNTMSTNVSRSESFRRYALGLIILGVFFANPSLPAWVTLIALYPRATALVQWDPAIALFEKLLRKSADKISQVTMGNVQKI